MMKFFGTFSQAIVILIALPVLALLIGWVPGGAAALDTVFWEFVDTISLFQGWAAVLSQYAGGSMAMITPEEVVSALLGLLFSAFLEAMVIGLCVSIAQQCCMYGEANQNGRWRYRSRIRGLPLLPSFVGVVIGVALVKYFNLAGVLVSDIAALVCVIGLMLIGIGTMLGIRHYSMRGARSYILSELLNVFAGAVVSVCACGAATALMQISHVAGSGFGWLAMLGWYLILIGLVALGSVILVALKSGEK